MSLPLVHLSIFVKTLMVKLPPEIKEDILTIPEEGTTHLLNLPDRLEIRFFQRVNSLNFSEIDVSFQYDFQLLEIENLNKSVKIIPF